MTNSKNRTIRLFAWLGAILFGVLLAFMPFIVNKDKTRLDVYADDVESYGFSFTGSSIYIPMRFSKSSDDGYPSSFNTSCCFSVDFKRSDLSSSSFDIRLNGSFLMDYFHDSDNQIFTTSNAYYSYSLGSSFRYNYFHLFDVDNQLVEYFIYDVWINCDALMGVPVYVTYHFEQQSSTWGGFYIKYYDIDNNKLDIALFYNISYFYNTATEDFFINIPSRTYYFTNAYDFTDNSYYQQGFSDGNSQGLTSGYNNGYTNGYDEGFSVGERSGFNQGVASANDYSFLGLFGAIVDAPLQAFTGLFDFDISFDGVHNFNLKGFFLAILTIAIVVAIIRFALSK